MTTEIPNYDLEVMANKVVAIKEKIAHHRDELRDAIGELEDFTDLLDTSIEELEFAESHLIGAQQGIINAVDTLGEQV